MVSKPTGRPIGRPRKPRPPRRSRAGRPPQLFPRDPDRYAVALLDALDTLEAGSGRACAAAVTAPLLDVLQTYSRRPTTGLEGLALTLRSKQRRIGNRATKTLDPTERWVACLIEINWRRVMGSAFMLALGAQDRIAAKQAILQRAETVGEGEFARTVMWPMVDAKFDALPEFSGNFVSTHEAK
jgi:hypothetical protein